MQINKISEAISRVKGVGAIVLGGSQSRGEADEMSDYDIGVYYHANALDIAELAQCLKELDDAHRENLMNPPGQWGPWINGGAWITFNGIPVDILLRDIERVEAVLQDCIVGNITIDYQCGHPFGFVNTIYAAETHYCKLLWQDKSYSLDRLKDLLYSSGEYSPVMRETLVKRFLWEAWFSLACGRKAALKGDINYTMGSVFRTVCSWVYVLYALNNCYLMNEKAALRGIDGFKIKPVGLEARVKDIYKLIADGNPGKANQMLDQLHNGIEKLANDIMPINTVVP